jgi:hypothetical protein
MVENNFNKLGWAKTDADGNPGLSVFEHCRHVGWVAYSLIESGKNMPSTLTPLAAAVIAAIHDVGKWSPDFLHKCPKWLEQRGLVLEAERNAWPSYDKRHEAISQFSIKLLLQLRNFSSSEATAWSMIAGAHHGRMHKSDRLDKKNLAHYVNAFPTPVGMNRELPRNLTMPTCVPHTRGDEPSINSIANVPAPRSPHPWG